MLRYPGEHARQSFHAANCAPMNRVAPPRRFSSTHLELRAKDAPAQLNACQKLPRLMSEHPGSRYVINSSHRPECPFPPSEATHELMLALEHSGLDRYAHPTQAARTFRRMQNFQIRCATDPGRSGYRRGLQ